MIDRDGNRGERLAYNITDAAKALGIGRTTIHRMINSGEIRTFTIRGMRRIAAAEIKRIMKEDEPA